MFLTGKEVQGQGLILSVIIKPSGEPCSENHPYNPATVNLTSSVDADTVGNR